MATFTTADKAIFDTILTYCKSIGFADCVTFDVDHFPGESNYYIRTRFSAFACMRRVSGKTDYCVEYFGHNDDDIVTLVCPDIESAIRTLKFVQDMLSDVAKKLDNLL